MKEKIAKWYAQGLWTKKMVRNAVEKKVISETNFEEITGEKYK